MRPPPPNYFRIFDLFRATIDLGEQLAREQRRTGRAPHAEPLSVNAILELDALPVDALDALGAPPLPAAAARRPAGRRRRAA